MTSPLDKRSIFLFTCLCTLTLAVPRNANVTLSSSLPLENGWVEMKLSVMIQNYTVDDTITSLMLSCMSNASSTSVDNWGVFGADAFGTFLTQIEIHAVVIQSDVFAFTQTVDEYVSEGDLSTCLGDGMPQFSLYSKAFPGLDIEALPRDNGTGQQTGSSQSQSQQSQVKVWIIGVVILAVAVVVVVAFVFIVRRRKANRAAGNGKGQAVTVEDGFVPDFNADKGDCDDDAERGDGMAGAGHFVPISVPSPGRI